ncbi:MAG: diguanylate cyclase domain-containing protein [Hydrogenovibrio sp.]
MRTVSVFNKPSIRWTIFSLFILLVMLTIGVLLLTQYVFNERFAYTQAEARFVTLVERLEAQRQALNDETRRDLKLLAQVPNLNNRVTLSESHPALTPFVQLLANRPQAYAVYVAREEGDFYEVINLASDPRVPALLQAPAGARWALVLLSDEDDYQFKHFHFLDERLTQLSERRERTRYQPQKRPWFQAARQQQAEVVSSKPYLFNHLNATGVTYSYALKDGSVLAMDYTLSFLARDLARFKPTADSRVFVFDEHGRIQFSEAGWASDALSQGFLADIEPMSLSPQEQAFVEAAPVIRVSNQRDWPPFDFVEAGQPKGFSIDLMRVLAAKTGLRFQFVNDYTFREMLQALQNGGLDLVHTVFKTPSREALGDFGKAHFDAQNSFITRQNVPVIDGFSELKGQTLAMVDGWSTTDYIDEHYPNIKLLRVPDIMTALDAVQQGKAYATIDTPESFYHLRSIYGLDDLTVNQSLPLRHPIHDASLYLLVSNDLPDLRTLLNRALSEVSPRTLNTLKKRWNLRENAREDALEVRVPDAFVQTVKQQQPYQVFGLHDENVNWLAAYATLPEASRENLYLGMMTPKNTVLGPYRHMMSLSGLAGIVIFVLMLPIIWWVTSRLVHPIYRLRHMAALVKKKRFDEVKAVDSHIKELHQLSYAMHDMALGVRDYEAEQRKTVELQKMFVDHLKENEKVLESRVQERTRALEQANQQLQDSREKLRYQAFHDALTGLPNRQAFNHFLADVLSTSVGFALVMVDLNKFKAINDTHGHAAGDHILVEVANRLQQAVSAGVRIARIGGDEFVMIWPGLMEQADADRMKQRLVDEVEGPCEYIGTRLEVSLSIGVARYPQQATTEVELFRLADEAMYEHKMARKMVRRSTL